MKKLLLVALLAAAGAVLGQRRRGRDEESLWTEASKAADLR